MEDDKQAKQRRKRNAEHMQIPLNQIAIEQREHGFGECHPQGENGETAGIRPSAVSAEGHPVCGS